MTIRNMSNDFDGFNFYRSSFDPSTGTIVRVVDFPESIERYRSPSVLGSVQHFRHHKSWSSEGKDLAELWESRYGRSYTPEATLDNPVPKKRYSGPSHFRLEKPFSPVPETIDVKITNWCNGPGGELCNYCYMGSDTSGKHAPKELLKSLFSGLAGAPYQIAFGGGEPTSHPDFEWFLQYTREQGTVPNYTTAGHLIRPSVIKATNLYCGGVALSYHAFKGPAWFKDIYQKWRAALEPHIQLNVHLIFDDNVAENLQDLIDMGLDDLNVVLLAYYPDIGRSDMSGLPSKGTYQVRLPAVLKESFYAGVRVAFSEGLLPYFLSHQFEEVDTRFAMQQEGLSSCYVDDKGYVSHSSFSPPDEHSPNIYERSFQDIWNRLEDAEGGYDTQFTTCESCRFKNQCHVCVPAHYMLCNFAEHNQTAAIDVAPRKRSLQVIT